MARSKKQSVDRDGDGLSDREELLAGTNLDSSDTDQDGVDDATELNTGNPNVPREPETEKARQMREQYLLFTRAVLGNSMLTYTEVYQRYLGNVAGARSLDLSVAIAALKAGYDLKTTIQLLAQGLVTQAQARTLTPEAKKAALPGILKYTQSTVDQAQRQRYVEYANTVTGRQWSYPDLYREYVGSDLAGIQLDQKIAAAALNAGESAQSVTELLHQGPYSQFQVGVKQVNPATIQQYGRGTVAQVQDIQALKPQQIERTRQRSKDLER